MPNTTMMPTDANGNSIPCLGYRKNDGAHTIAINANSNRNTTPFNQSTRIVTVFATVNCFFELGNDTVTATTSRHFLPAGIMIDIDLGGKDIDSYMAVIRSATDGSLYISERT